MKGRSELAPYLANLGHGDVKEHSAQTMTRAYADSVFVPAPRGWRVLDCFRDYEATRMGAIPVVVADGRSDEVERSFGHYYREPPGSLPPWVFAKSWTEAGDMMVALMKNMTALEEMQAANLRWWDRVNYNLRRGIYEALRDNDALPPPSS
uniref:RXYLT1 C-terminal domain-containing protein n=1 Tax=Neobodo designis TaxID=312471 RepID=A0A7S1VZ76_NEODS